MKLLPRRRGAASADPSGADGTGDALDPVPARIPDPSLPSEARGSWEQAALTNVAITEVIKRQLNVDSPPWKK